MGIYRQMFLLFNKSYAIQNSIVHGNVEINDYYSEEFEVKTMNENKERKLKGSNRTLQFTLKPPKSKN